MAKLPSNDPNLTWITRQVEQSVRSLTRAAAELARQRRSVINGVFGGLVTATASYVVSVALPAYNSPYFFALMTGTGLAGGLAVTRALSSRRDEQELEHNEMKAQLILERIDRLPPATPAAIRKQLWDDYVAVTHELIRTDQPAPPGD